MAKKTKRRTKRVSWTKSHLAELPVVNLGDVIAERTVMSFIACPSATPKSSISSCIGRFDRIAPQKRGRAEGDHDAASLPLH
jgi:hypothetical protein